MAKRCNGTKLLVHSILLLLLFTSLVQIFISAGQRTFFLESLGLIFLILLGFLGFVGYSRSWGRRSLFFLYLFYIINLILVWHVLGSLYLVLLFLALIGFLLSLPRRGCKKCTVPVSTEPYSQVFDPPPQKKVVAKHSPGKYIASSRSNIFHTPKCEWAAKINQKGRRWFKDKEAAFGEGLKAHKCVN